MTCIHNPKVGSSILPPATKNRSSFNKLQALLTPDRFCFAEILPRMKRLSMNSQVQLVKTLKRINNLDPATSKTLGAILPRFLNV